MEGADEGIRRGASRIFALSVQGLNSRSSVDMMAQYGRGDCGSSCGVKLKEAPRKLSPPADVTPDLVPPGCEPPDLCDWGASCNRTHVYNPVQCTDMFSLGNSRLQRSADHVHPVDRSEKLCSTRQHRLSTPPPHSEGAQSQTINDKTRRFHKTYSRHIPHNVSGGSEPPVGNIPVRGLLHGQGVKVDNQSSTLKPASRQRGFYKTRSGKDLESSSTRNNIVTTSHPQGSFCDSQEGATAVCILMPRGHGRDKKRRKKKRHGDKSKGQTSSEYDTSSENLGTGERGVDPKKKDNSTRRRQTNPEHGTNAENLGSKERFVDPKKKAGSARRRQTRSYRDTSGEILGSRERIVEPKKKTGAVRMKHTNSENLGTKERIVEPQNKGQGKKQSGTNVALHVLRQALPQHQRMTERRTLSEEEDDWNRDHYGVSLESPLVTPDMSSVTMYMPPETPSVTLPVTPETPSVTLPVAPDTTSVTSPVTPDATSVTMYVPPKPTLVSSPDPLLVTSPVTPLVTLVSVADESSVSCRDEDTGECSHVTVNGVDSEAHVTSHDTSHMCHHDSNVTACHDTNKSGCSKGVVVTDVYISGRRSDAAAVTADDRLHYIVDDRCHYTADDRQRYTADDSRHHFTADDIRHYTVDDRHRYIVDDRHNYTVDDRRHYTVDDNLCHYMEVMEPTNNHDVTVSHDYAEATVTPRDVTARHSYTEVADVGSCFYLSATGHMYPSHLGHQRMRGALPLWPPRSSYDYLPLMSLDLSPPEDTDRLEDETRVNAFKRHKTGNQGTQPGRLLVTGTS